MDALGSAIRATNPSPPPSTGRRAEDLVLAVASRAGGAEPVLQRRSVEPIFRRPSLEPATRRPGAEPAPGQAAAEPEAAAPAPPSPPFEWLDLEIIPLGQKPAPRGYAVYAQAPRPEPAPVILIDTAI